ncbi:MULTISPECIES: hypothetical protein [Brevibacillus]|jgi:hypothetical protein|uniref:Uncharacterized protein n=1 Tax=Brevibacillus parabrevis TaxID=54914 RepID=A0A4Y3PFS2_BREPA|nr:MULTISPECIES: hypothetical protein [Brevibacillus]TGV24962.1 hypothetical protein EN829_044035 [Mesorhizobium sp. M00.F.Ca.ET.186.01.1.1]KZE50078.1 hypothetical protein AV540_14130 [Brevibacillus parabrevis]MBU8715015.1 hypothetical protein [Brevibacillus parabrevis]MDH6352337.1 hypothetical protein [Brevibacillus sp. 1238]MDR5000053.1 hypothetical protein [Brevibacillus parabrevis]
MQELFDKMKEYLNMDTEISFDEFDGYYKQVVAFLNDNWKELNEEDSMRMLFILDNLKSNGEDRSKRKVKEAKKYAKMAQRTEIWANALIGRLREAGLTDEEIGKRYEAIYEAV